jgi:malonyl CoA-acyl carrier protein transacylase
MPVLIEKANNGNARFFLQFGGQGSHWLSELSRLYDNPSLRTFFDVAIDSLLEETERFKGHDFFDHGFDVRGWIQTEGAAPPEEYLESTGVSLPMIQLAQLAHLEHFLSSGIPSDTVAKFSEGVTGHSQGLISAAFFSQAAGRSNYYDLLALYMKFAFYLGFRSQEQYPYPRPTPEQIERSNALELEIPGPMAAVIGNDEGFIAELVASFNERGAHPPIHIGLHNSPRNRVLCSHRESLLDFIEVNREELDRREFRFVFLQITCPFHSPYLKGAATALDADMARIGFQFTGGDLRLPLYSFYDGSNLQNEKNLERRLYMDMIDHTLYWENSIRPAVSNPAVTHILDFGPGKTSQRLTQAILDQEKSSIPILCAALPRDFKKMTE